MKRILLGIMVAASSIGLVGTAMAVDGAAIYRSKCAMCHGADGQGSFIGNAFKGSKFITSGNEKMIIEVILKGRNGAEKMYKEIGMGMPAQKLSDAEVSAVIAHLKTLASK